MQFGIANENVAPITLARQALLDECISFQSSLHAVVTLMHVSGCTGMEAAATSWGYSWPQSAGKPLAIKPDGYEEWELLGAEVRLAHEKQRLISILHQRVANLL